MSGDGGFLFAEGGGLPQRALDRAAPPIADVLAGRRRVPTASGFDSLDVVIWSMHRSVRTALGIEAADRTAQVIRALPALGGRLRLAALQWVDLVDTLVHDAEARHERQRGAGGVKAAEVRAAIDVVLRQDAFVGVPIASSARPLLLGPLLDWTMDGVVFIANQHGLWVTGAAAVRTPPRPWRAVVLGLAATCSFVAAGAHRVAAASGRAAERLRRSVHPPRRSDAEFEAKAPRAEEFARAARWLGNERPGAVGLLEIVGRAVQRADMHDALSGPAKRSFARDLTLLMLADLVSDEGRYGASPLARSLAGFAVDATALLFAKHGLTRPWDDHRR